jgi:hypothetical protein
MKKSFLLLGILMLSGSFLFAQQVTVKFVDVQVITGNRPPNPGEAQLMRAEEANHPNITKAVRDIDNAMKALQNAPDDFGGHKAQAESDLKQSWISLRKALYFRIYKDTH